MEQFCGIYQVLDEGSMYYRAVPCGEPPYEIKVFPWSRTEVFVLDSKVNRWPMKAIGTEQQFANLTLKVVGAKWALCEFDDLELVPEAFYVDVVRDNWPF